MKIINRFFLVTLCLNLGHSYAQNNQVKKANTAFDQFEYIKARTLYLEEVDRGNRNPQMLKKLADTYYFVADYENAARWYEKIFELHPDIELEPLYYFRAAQSFKSIEGQKLSDSLMQIYFNHKSDQKDSHIYTQLDSLYKATEFKNKIQIEAIMANSDYSDITPSYYFDQVVFASARILDTINAPELYVWNKQPFLNLYSAFIATNGQLHNIRALTGDLASFLHESSTSFTPDGKQVYFTRNNLKNGKKIKDDEDAVKLKIFSAEKTGENRWGNLVELPFNEDVFNTAHPALSPDGNRLYFASDRPGGIGQSDIWFVERLSDSTYGTPVNLGSTLNTELRESFPFVDENNVLYFSTNGHPGFGGLDIFYTPLDENGFPTKIFRMPQPINSPSDDFSLIRNAQTKTGYFSSNRNSSNISNNDNLYYFREICEITLNGVVTNKRTNELLPDTQVTLLSNQNIITVLTAGENADFQFDLSCDVAYTLVFEKESYDKKEVLLTTPDVTSDLTLTVALQPTPHPCGNDLGCRLNLKPIYFDLDKHFIRSDAEIELNKVLNALLENPNMNIHIESHTDSRGRDAYNLALSDRRAKSTMNWLIDKGISPERLTAKGYGETRLLNECGNGVKCSEEQHQLNRRSVFTIVQE